MHAGTGVSARRESRKWKPESIHHLCYVFRRTSPAYAPVSVIIFHRLIAVFQTQLKAIENIPSVALKIQNLELLLLKIFYIFCCKLYSTYRKYYTYSNNSNFCIINYINITISSYKYLKNLSKIVGINLSY